MNFQLYEYKNIFLKEQNYSSKILVPRNNHATKISINLVVSNVAG